MKNYIDTRFNRLNKSTQHKKFALELQDYLNQLNISGGSSTPGSNNAIVENNNLTFDLEWTHRGVSAPLSGALNINLSGAITSGKEVIRYNGPVSPFPIVGVTLIGDDNFQPNIDMHIVFWHVGGLVYANYITPKYLSNNPFATNVSMTGIFDVGQILTGSYDYFGGTEGELGDVDSVAVRFYNAINI